jgi:hypothetical protein
MAAVMTPGSRATTSRCAKKKLFDGATPSAVVSTRAFG